MQPRSTSALLGVAAAGPYAVDLRRDGPHVLVGGTTGAGKSELLQTLIASLALGNRPDEMSFVLVDYKGGSAFKECAQLPHTVGLVTDLDGHLAGAGADLAGGRAQPARAPARRRSAPRTSRTTRPPPALPTPGCRASAGPGDRRVQGCSPRSCRTSSTGWSGSRRVGRSLGIHLVLATQRPAGIVSADIKANVNLRIALRVRDTVDSDDVIDAPVAQAIPERTPGPGLRPLRGPAPRALPDRPGRRTGPRAGGRPTSACPGGRGTPPETHLLARPTRGAAGGPTDLAQVVEVTTGAARIAGIARPSSPWLPPLPDLVVADRLLADPWHVPYALADLPRQQAQRPVTWDLENDGHLAVAGASRTGRTSFLRTLAGTIATRLSPTTSTSTRSTAPRAACSR